MSVLAFASCSAFFGGNIKTHQMLESVFQGIQTRIPLLCVDGGGGMWKHGVKSEKCPEKERGRESLEAGENPVVPQSSTPFSMELKRRKDCPVYVWLSGCPYLNPKLQPLTCGGHGGFL